MATAATNFIILPETGPFVGKALVHSKEGGAPHDLHITQAQKENGVITFSAYVAHEERYALIGELSITWLRTLPTGKFGSEDDPDIRGIRSRYSSARKTDSISKVYIKLLNSFENRTYAGVGTALTQVAIETAFQFCCQGRIILDAVWNSHPFWYKMGMRSLYQKTTLCEDDEERTDDERVLQEITLAKSEGREPQTDNLRVQLLYLPPAAIATWEERIASSPILFRV